MNAILEIEFNKFMELRFPKRTSENKQLGDLYLELLQYDAQLAGLMSKMIKNYDTIPDDLVFNDELQDRFTLFISTSCNEEDIANANACLEYLASIKHLLNIVNKNK